MINPKKFKKRKNLFSDILIEIFNVESNYNIELCTLNTKLTKKIEEYKNKLLKKPTFEKLRQSLSIRNNKNNFKHSNSNSTISANKSENNLLEYKEENINDDLISNDLQQLLNYYKEKQKLISNQVSNLGIILYTFSSRKKSDENMDSHILEKIEKVFDGYYEKLTKAKNKYFEKMNELELFFHNQEKNNINSKDNVKDKDNKNKSNKINNIINKINNKINDEEEKDKIEELHNLRKNYKKILDDINNSKKTYINKVNEISNEIQEFNINENEILYEIFKIYNDSLTNLLKEVNKLYLFYDNNKKLIENLNIEFSNNLLFKSKIDMNYQFEEYNPKFSDINNKNHLSVIQKMNKLIGFEFDKFKHNNSNNNIINNEINNVDNNTDNNALFILLMDKFLNIENQLNDKEKHLLKGLFNQENYINEFLKKLNNIRINKKLFNSKEKFDLLVELFNEIYTKVSFDDENKHEFVKFLMILSETFYYKDENGKIFLNSFIKLPPQIKDDKFWIRYIELEIENETKKYENSKKDSKYEYIILLSNTTHLKEYITEKEKLKDIIDYFQEKYNFTNNDIDVIKNQLKI